MTPLTSTHQKRRSAFQSFLLNSKGNAVVEYAIITGAVIAGAIACAVLIGSEIKSTTSDVAAVLNDGSIVDYDRSIEVPDSTTLAAPMSRLRMSDIALVLVYGVAVVAFIVAWRSRKRIRKRTAVVERDPDQFARNRLRIHSVLKSLRHEKVKNAVRVEHVMDTRFSCIKPNARRADIVSKLIASATGVLLVTDETGRLLGAIEQADLDLASGTNASQIMRSVTDHTEVNAYLSSAIEIVHRRRLRWIPVLAGGVVRGVLSTDDLFATLLCTLQMINEIDDEYRIILQRAVGLGEHA